MKTARSKANQKPKRFSGISPFAATRWAIRLAADVDAVIAKFPKADPEDVRLTLISLQSTPLERLNRSLRRGQGFAAFKK